MSLNTNGVGDAVALITDMKNNKKGIVYYDRTNNAGIDLAFDDIDDELLSYVFGKTALARTSKTKLKNKLMADVEEMNDEQLRHLKQYKAPKNHKLFPLPMSNEYDERHSYLVSGMAGSGKSRWVMRMVNLYHKMGINNIYVISSKLGDKDKYKQMGVNEYIDIDKLVDNTTNGSYFDKLNSYKEKKIKLKYLKKTIQLDDDSLMDLEIELEKMKPDPRDKTVSENYVVSDFYKNITKKPSLFIFDDFETLEKDKLMRCWWFIDYLLINERSRGVNVITILHKNTNGPISRNVMNESQSYVIFKRNLFKSYHYVLSNYLGMSSKEIQRIRDILKHSNFVLVDRLNKMVIAENQVFLF